MEILKQIGGFRFSILKKYLSKESEYCTGILAFERNKPVGYLWIIRRGGNEACFRIRHTDAAISCVFVDKEYRGRNIANFLISKAIEILKAERSSEVALSVSIDNRGAISAYQKAGFQIEGDRTYLRILGHNFPYQSI